MFDRIAGVYDPLNTAMTAGLHHRWRSRAVDLAGVGPGSRVLDVATGTGDLAIELARRVEPIPPPASADGLSFEQVQNEFLQNLAPPTARPAPPATATQVEPPPITRAPPLSAPEPPVEPLPATSAAPAATVEDSVPYTAERDQALQVIAVLEQWLDAIHVARAQPHA